MAGCEGPVPIDSGESRCRDSTSMPNRFFVVGRRKREARKDGIICAMQEPISDDRTVAGGGKDMILAGRYHILRQFGQEV